AHIVAISRLQLGRNLLGQVCRYRRAGRPSPVKLRLLAAGYFAVHEEEQLVFYNRPAQAEAGLVVVVAGADFGVGPVHALARYALRAPVAVHRAVEIVGARARHGVNRAAGEVAQRHIKRGYLRLNLL
nr:hypothetical protein [Tanacetum cinerariifolium]